MKKLFLILALFMLACGIPGFAAAPAPIATLDPNAIITAIVGTADASSTQTALVVTPSFTPTLTPLPTATIAPTLTSVPTPTLTAYGKYTIEYLRARTYGGGQLTLVNTVSQQKNFTTYLAKYSSDGLTMYALVSAPKDTQKRAVVITLHGYSNADEYDFYDDNRFMDIRFAQEGFIVIHPAMRNYPPSDSGDNLFRVGQAIDVLNLLAIIKEQSGTPGLLEYADGENIGVEGSSTGGGVALRMLTVGADIKAVVLYSSISGDERHNIPLFRRFARDPQFAGELGVADSALATISSAPYYASITAPVLLIHGTKDPTIPLDWAKETCNLLGLANVRVTCNYYDKAGHSFWGPDRENLLAQASAFFNTYLR